MKNLFEQKRLGRFCSAYSWAEWKRILLATSVYFQGNFRRRLQ
jgi:hypothetical protein